MYTYSTYLLHAHAQQDVDVHDTMIYIYALVLLYM